MRHPLLRIAALLLCCAVCFSTPLPADPIRVTGGQLTSGPFGGSSFTFTGDGLVLTAGIQGGILSPLFDCEPCVVSPAIPLSFSASLSSAVFSSGSSGQFAGVAYARTFLSGAMTFAGPGFSSAVLSPSNLTFTAPFSMTASIENYADSPRAGAPIFTASLFGTGIATASFVTVVDPNLGRLFDARNITYQFTDPAATATPEPATLVLMGTGIAGLLARRRCAT
jgi:hypothetical protein